MAADRARIAWTAAPDPDGGVYYQIVTPKPNKEVVVVVLSECIEGVMTYFTPPLNPGENGQTMPCTCGEQECPGRLAGRSHRWKGYLACWNVATGRLVLAEVTKEAYLRCPDFEVFKGALRGKMLRLTRTGTAANSRVLAKLTPPVGQPRELPPAFNVRSALERMWLGERTRQHVIRSGKSDGKRLPDADEGNEVEHGFV